jgi:CRP-like cAMP-binding protein
LIEPHLTKLRARDDISPQEEQAIRAAVAEFRDYPANRTIIKAGVELDYSTLLLGGIMNRHKDLRNGERQITEIQIAGDFVDLHSFTLKRLDHHIATMTPCRVGIVPHERLKAITREHPHLTRVYWFSTNLDAAIHREWELSLGRRTAIARVAAFFCELRVRLGIVGLTDGDSYLLPLTQLDIAECLGLTSVHVNRTLRELREQGLVEVRRGRVTIQNLAGLERVAEFDPSYLYLERRPR